MKFLSIFLFLAIFISLFSNIYSQTHEEIQLIENKGEGLWNNSRRLVFDFKNALEVDETKGIFFAEVSDIDTDSLGNIYVCDKKDHCIKVFDDSGNFKYFIGRHGKGPGELINPESIFIAFNKIYISDSNRRINVFDLKGTFIEIFTAHNFMINDLCISSSNKFLFCTPVSPMHHFKEKVALPGIHILNLTANQWAEIGELSYIGKTDNGYQTIGNSMISPLSSGNILYATGYPYELKKYTETGELKTIITRKAKEIAKPKIFEIAPGIKILIPRTEIRKIIPLPNGNFMIVVADLGKNFLKLYEKSHDFNYEDISIWYDVYNSNGELLQSFPLENPFEIGLIMHCDHNNFVYTYSTEWETQTVKKYSISFKRNN